MSLYRGIVFGAKGLSEYTRSGFESAAKRFNQADTEVDLSGQHVMITGANSVSSDFVFEKNSVDYIIILGHWPSSCTRMCQTKSFRSYGMSR